ncbi:hypothetical protein IOD16_39050 [Saccharothrix sp. 6-C]|uniref:Uncharacterized protein n=1 Tax=Saccharothrix texasensis TaxID=103734 RepID=A0A3N1H8D4_9PSEU|nr:MULTISPECIES: hypothetical protein [Saccharothrix]QQQ81075.1 hypothetical protein IOD16_39050 [Saccharothrix sp. 6-C]ROP38799.1 hypothetical protein EDD40_4163 [Saccharothrix texasensis]
MSVHTLARTVAAPADVELLGTLVAEPESAITDPPLPAPNAAGAVLLAALLLLSAPDPKEPRK